MIPIEIISCNYDFHENHYKGIQNGIYTYARSIAD